MSFFAITNWKSGSDANCLLRFDASALGVGICSSSLVKLAMQRNGTPMASTGVTAAAGRYGTVRPFITSTKFARRCETVPEYCFFRPCGKRVRTRASPRWGQVVLVSLPGYASLQK